MEWYLGRLCGDQNSLAHFPAGLPTRSSLSADQSRTRALLGLNISKCNSICSRDNVTSAGSSLLGPGAICVLGAVLGTHGCTPSPWGYCYLQMEIHPRGT